MNARVPAIGPYQVVREIGRGGMGVVVHARAPDGRDVAVKVLLEHVARKEGVFERFDRERRLLASLGEDAGFVPLLDAGRTAQGPFLVMPFLAGGTLRQRLEKDGKLAVTEAVALIERIAQAVGRAHEQGIVHRDLKPENVLFAADGRPFVSDLGLAKHFRGDVSGASQSVALSKTGEARGTVTYMAPEQSRDAKNVGPQADVFALGAILYELVSGQAAFTGGSGLEVLVRVQEARFEPLRNVAPDAPRWVAAVVARALARDPAARYPDASALAAALAKGDTGEGSRRGPMIAGVAVLLIAATTGVVVATRSETRARDARPEPAAPVVPVANPDVERATQLSQQGDHEGALDAWEKVLRQEGPGRKPATVRSTWLAATAAGEARLVKEGPERALDPVKRVKALVADEPPEVALLRARVELVKIVRPPAGRAESDSELRSRAKKVRELLVKVPGVARDLDALANPLDELVAKLIGAQETDLKNLPDAARLFTEVRPFVLAAQDARPGHHVPRRYVETSCRWAVWASSWDSEPNVMPRFDVVTAARGFGASRPSLHGRTGPDSFIALRSEALRLRQRHLTATRAHDVAGAGDLRRAAVDLKKNFDRLAADAKDSSDDPAFQDALGRVLLVQGDLASAIVAIERSVAALGSWETLVEASRLRVLRGELELAHDDAHTAIKCVEFETLEFGVDARQTIALRSRCHAVALRQRATVARELGRPAEAEDDERRAAQAEADAEKLKLPLLDVD